MTKDPQPVAESSSDLITLLSEKVVGQPAALKYIVPYIEMHRAGLCPEGRPVGVFLLLGPTGTGKTKTVEALADILHGSEKNVVRVDCGEYQMEHEVAKLIGAPPGYLGHRDTTPILTQQKLTNASSDRCDLSIVLFDEIEKAASSLSRLLLGILDKAILRLGDNTTVNFEHSLIFLTSNLGAREMMKEINPDFGFQSGVPTANAQVQQKLESVALAAVRRKFSPEFVNRIDAVITYQPLDEEALGAILDRQVAELQRHVNTRLGERCFSIQVPQDAREFLLRNGTSKEYGARELKRVIHRNVTQPLATMVASGNIQPGSVVQVQLAEDRESIVLRTTETAFALPEHPVVLIVDDNRDLVRLFELQLSRAKLSVVTAESGRQAEDALAKQVPNVVVLDYMLPDINGVDLAARILRSHQNVEIVMVTGAELAPEDEFYIKSQQLPVLRKPFLAEELTSLIRNRLSRSAANGEPAHN